MFFDFATLAASDRYKLLVATVLPRPIGLVTTIDANGRVNAAPFSFFNAVGDAPPLLVLGVQANAGGRAKDSWANIEASGEFVVNLVSETIAPQMNICAIDFPPEIDELAMAGLEAAPSERVRPPRIAASPVSYECALYRAIPLDGGGAVILGEVRALHVADEFVDAEKLYVAAEKMGLIARMHGRGMYARTTDLFEMKRITYAEWQAAQGPDPRE